MRCQDLVAGGAQKSLGFFHEATVDIQSLSDFLQVKVHWKKLNCCKSRGRVPQCPIAGDVNAGLSCRVA